jgi:hypothetical protein
MHEFGLFWFGRLDIQQEATIYIYRPVLENCGLFCAFSAALGLPCALGFPRNNIICQHVNGHSADASSSHRQSYVDCLQCRTQLICTVPAHESMYGNPSSQYVTIVFVPSSMKIASVMLTIERLTTSLYLIAYSRPVLSSMNKGTMLRTIEIRSCT